MVLAPLIVRWRFLLGNTVGSCLGQKTHVLLHNSVVLISTVRIESRGLSSLLFLFQCFSSCFLLCSRKSYWSTACVGMFLLILKLERRDRIALSSLWWNHSVLLLHYLRLTYRIMSMFSALTFHVSSSVLSLFSDLSLSYLLPASFFHQSTTPSNSYLS